MAVVLPFVQPAIVRLRIDHVRNTSTPRAALTPAMVLRTASVTIETRNVEAIDAILRAVRSTAIAPEMRPVDLRYAMRFEDRRGNVRRSVCIDAFGTRGELDGQAVRFASDAIKRAIVAAFPALVY